MKYKKCINKLTAGDMIYKQHIGKILVTLMC